MDVHEMGLDKPLTPDGACIAEPPGWFVVESDVLGCAILVARDGEQMRHARKAGREEVGYLESCVEGVRVATRGLPKGQADEVTRALHDLKATFRGGISTEPPTFPAPDPFKDYARRKKAGILPSYKTKVRKGEKKKGVTYISCGYCSPEKGHLFLRCRMPTKRCKKRLFCPHAIGFVEEDLTSRLRSGICATCQVLTGMLVRVECESCAGECREYEIKKGLCPECLRDG